MVVNVSKTGNEALVAQNEKPWQKKRRLARLAECRGSQYPPFSIEPMPHERQRLDGKGMTDADRQLRKQWLLDQNLSPNEPRYVPEVHPRNIFKRIGSMPFEALYKVNTIATYFTFNYFRIFLEHDINKYYALIVCIVVGQTLEINYSSTQGQP